MKMTIATGYGTLEIPAPVPMPEPEVSGPPRPTERAQPSAAERAAAARTPRGAAATRSSLRSLSLGARQETRDELRVLAILWTAAWLTLLLALA